MLREIINFTKSLYEVEPGIFLRTLKPANALHLIIWLNENGNLEKYEYDVFSKKKELTPFFQQCVQRQYFANCVSANKRLDVPYKLNKSCSPFAVFMDKESLLTGIKKKGVSLNEYFDKVKNEALKYCETEKEKVDVQNFYQFCGIQLIPLLEQILKELKLSKNLQINIYLGNVSLPIVEKTYMNYLRPKVFNKDEFNIQKNGQTFGVSDYLTGFNEKKPFLRHLTATFDVNYRVSEEDALWLYRFMQLKANKQLPNPLPIFIDKQELNQEVVSIFLDKEGNIQLSEIIRSVYDKYNDLGNYYLLNIQGKTIKDFDFVSSFKIYFENNIRIKPIFMNSGNLVNKNIKNVFEFEKEIVQRIFNNQLVQYTKNGIRYRYFDDIDYNPLYISATEHHIVLKYRKAFYDYIYKSKREAVNSHMFHDIMQSIILDEIRHDEQHKKELSIKEKLNIWFSLYEFFEQPYNKGEIGAMANLTLQLQQRIKEIAENAEAHIENDNEFAFATGQVIYYLLSQSETANKTHALLEPFIQKTNSEQLKIAISRTLDRYKHNIHFGHQKFNKLMSEVLGYTTEQNLKNLLPIILAGYFSNNVLYGKRTDQDAPKENENNDM